MPQPPSKVRIISISADEAGQRIDNFLSARLKGVPRSHIYQLLRSGQVRVNSGRKKPQYRLRAGDDVRIPPVTTRPTTRAHIPTELQQRIEAAVLLETDDLLVIDKPSGIPVHAGSGYHYGIIDILRASRPEDFVELVHRLDRDTSGCLLLARSRRSLAACHEVFRDGHAVGKHYLALVAGHWPGSRRVDAAIERVMRSGERMMQVSTTGQHAVSHFECQRVFDRPRPASLMRITIDTGRTHQIRVHAAAGQHPIAGDSKYGDRDFNAAMKALGLGRLFLHAEKLELELPITGKISATAPLPADLRALLDCLS